MYNYLIISDDQELCNKKTNEIKKQMNLDVETNQYDLEEDDIYNIIDDLNTISLFGTTKFLQVKSFEALSNISSNALTELLSVMNDTNSPNVLVFNTLKKLDNKNENIIKILKYLTTINNKIENISLPEYTLKSFSEDGYDIDESTVKLLCNYVDSISLLEQSIDILKSYKKNEKIITIDDVNKMISPPLDDDVYHLVEAVLSNDKKMVFECYNGLKIQNVQPTFLISLLINKFQEIYNSYFLLKAKYSQNQIAELFNVSPGRAYYLMKDAKNIPIKKIKDNLNYLNKLEYDIKSGIIDSDLGLELYFLK